MTARRVGAAVLAAAALACVASAPAGGAVRDGFYGINAQYVFSTPQSGWPAQFSSMVAGGLQVVRTDVRWSIAEPTPPDASGHHYDWSSYDTIAGTLARYGLDWMPTLGYPPPWAQENPTDIGSEMTLAHQPDFIAFATALVRRYGSGGTFWSSHPEIPAHPVREWEVWNEPNVTYYWDPQDNAPERYADLYLATRDAITAVNFKARVLFGGLALVNPPLASDEIKFIQRMFTHRPELGTSVDVWGLHPYQETIYWTFRRFARFRQALDKLTGRRVPIAISELGYTTTKVSDAERGSELTQLAQELPRSGCDIYDFVPYAWLSPEQDSTDPEQWFGIWNADGTPKPSGEQYVGAVLQMRGLSSTPPPSDQLNLCDSQYPVPPDPQPPAPPQSISASPPAAAQPAATATPAKPAGPALRLKVGAIRGRLLRLRAGCTTPCRLDAYLMVRRSRRSRYRTQATLRTRDFSTRQQTLRFRIRRRTARLFHRAEVVVVAYDRSGASSRRSRIVRLG